MLKHRIISGLLMGAAFLTIVFFVPQIWVWTLIALVSVIGQLEFYSMMDKAGIPVYRVVGSLCGVALISATYFTIGWKDQHMAAGYRLENVVLIASLILVFVRQFPQKLNPKPLETIGATLMGIMYVPFLFNYITRLAFGWSETQSAVSIDSTGRMLLLYLVFVVKTTDIGAFFTGSMFGRHKLLPRISPNKTWEGLIGGIIVALSTSMTFSYLFSEHLGGIKFPMLHAAILGVILSMAGTIGDLFESLLKRAANVKDSSAIIPGMGGVLDVIDSILFGAPILYGYICIFLI